MSAPVLDAYRAPSGPRFVCSCGTVVAPFTPRVVVSYDGERRRYGVLVCAGCARLDDEILDAVARESVAS